MSADPVFDDCGLRKLAAEQSLELVAQLFLHFLLRFLFHFLGLLLDDRFGRAGSDAAVVDLVLRCSERAAELDRHGQSLEIDEFLAALTARCCDDRCLDEIVERFVADIDIAFAAQPQQRRLARQVVVVRDPVLDVEGRAQLRKIGFLFLIRRLDRKSTRLNSSHIPLSRMPSSA